jgi:hypothetical protein
MSEKDHVRTPTVAVCGVRSLGFFLKLGCVSGCGCVTGCASGCASHHYHFCGMLDNFFGFGDCCDSYDCARKRRRS